MLSIKIAGTFCTCYFLFIGEIKLIIIFIDIVPFIISEDLKMFYYQGLDEWNKEKRCLIDTRLTAQDRFKKLLDYFQIVYKDE